MLTVTLFLLAFVIFVVDLWRGRLDQLPIAPTYPGGLPLIGNALQFLGDPIRLWGFIKKFSYHSLKCGGVSTVFLGRHRVYIITDPDDCMTLASTSYGKPFVYDSVKEWIGRGLIVAEVPLWKRHRKLINPMFSQRMLNKFQEVFNSQAVRLVDQLADRVATGTFDQQPILLANTLETICHIMLGMRIDETDPIIKQYYETFVDLVGVIVEKNQKFWLHIPFIYERSALKKKYDNLVAITGSLTNMVINRRKVEIKNSSINKNETNQNTVNEFKFRTILDHMLYLSMKQGEFCDEIIREHLESMVTAGFDTTTITLNFSLKLIGMNPRVQDRIFQELQDVFEGSNRDVHKYDLPKLVYLEAVIKETIRLYPAVPIIARQVVENVRLRNYTILADSIGVISVFGVSRHAMWGADAEQFRPERWLEPGGVPDNTNAFAGFSLAKRNCIGKYYALMSMKTTLAHLLRTYHVTADDKLPAMKYDITLRSVSGHDISIVLRKNKNRNESIHQPKHVHCWT